MAHANLTSADREVIESLLAEWSIARAVDGVKHMECMHMVAVGDRMREALRLLLSERLKSCASLSAAVLEAEAADLYVCSTSTSGEAFIEGARFAERQHGIGPAKPA